MEYIILILFILVAIFQFVLLNIICKNQKYILDKIEELKKEINS